MAEKIAAALCAGLLAMSAVARKPPPGADIARLAAQVRPGDCYSLLDNGCAPTDWKEHAATFESDGGRLIFAEPARPSGRDAFIDTIALTAAVPEPASVLLIVAGVVPLLAWRRRRQG